MKKNVCSRTGIFNRRTRLAFALCVIAAFLILIGLGLYSGESARAAGANQDQKNAGSPQVVQLVGPVGQAQDLRALPYIAPKSEVETHRLTRHPLAQLQSYGKPDTNRGPRESTQPHAMATPIATFDGMNATQSGCSCLPPDTQGDVGPNHYIQSVNSSIKIFDKSGNPLNGANGTTYNSFFSGLQTSGTPCGLNQNDGDGFVLYDQLADRWLVSDFAFSGFPGPGPFYQCIGISKTNDPVAGGWWLYAVQVDPSNTGFIGDYPKFGLWPDAYYFTVNLFSGLTTSTEAFEGVRVYALPRNAMINGTGAPNPGAIAFTILPAALGDAYSLVPATFRAGSAPPAGTPEYLMAIDSPATADVVLNQVKTWLFHVDFTTPASSTLGTGSGHSPNGTTTVNNFVDAFTSSTNIVPQTGTTAKLDTLGDKIMTPLVYQKLGSTESLWASHTVNNNQNGTGPTAIRWYQFDVSGGTIPPTPMQQQTFNNGGDGLWRFMPSIAVDGQGNAAIGYSVSSSSTNPAISYAGRFSSDPLNSMAQGEALLIQGAGHQTDSSGRWGDYSAMSIDPADNLTFWHTNEYYPTTSGATWDTRIGKFQFATVPQLVTAISRLTHTGVGPFDVNLPLTGTRGVECRSANSYSLVYTFAAPIANCGTPSQGTVSGGGGSNQCTITLSGLANAQYYQITLNGVVSSSGAMANVVGPRWGLLLGDINSTGGLTNADVSLVKTEVAAGGAVGASNFRNDVNLNGGITNADVSFVKAQVAAGAQLPTPP